VTYLSLAVNSGLWPFRKISVVNVKHYLVKGVKPSLFPIIDLRLRN